mmetsp:Transcript_78323/g.162742  ORF Transcript_78323/g.162742 Transcript_78323/m.162742 type:complete len:390 (+) Transcript_78323:168-1337(+)
MAGYARDALDRPRFGEHSKLVPVFAVIMTIFVLYSEYVLIHGFRLLQLDLPPTSRVDLEVARGVSELSFFHVFAALLMYCFARCILTHPGTIPDGDGWDLLLENEGNTREIGLIETKHTGERRQCKWCLKYKPDRCHHCRVCNMCILRMDHHCPWVYNCIGFRNHKYFFLVLVYASVTLGIIVFSMFETVWWSTRTDVPIPLMILLVAGEAFATFLFVIVTSFLAFHIWLMVKAMTTVEFCEKSLKKASYNSSTYSQGIIGNVSAVLGPNPLLWLLPVCLPKGDGINWSRHQDDSISSATSSRRPSEATAMPMPMSGRQRRAERTDRMSVIRKAPAPEPPRMLGEGLSVANTGTPSHSPAPSEVSTGTVGTAGLRAGTPLLDRPSPPPP